MIQRLDTSGTMFLWNTGQYVNYQDVVEMIRKIKQACAYSSSPDGVIRVETCNDILSELGVNE